MSSKNVLNHFEKIDSEEKAYWLGFLYADGSVSSSRNVIELCLAEKDYQHMVKFKNFIGLDNKIGYRETSKAYRYSFHSDKMKEDLINLGCVPKKSLILEYPTTKQVPKNLIRHFIRGYFDGDGWFSNTDSTFQVGLIGTQAFIEGFLKDAEPYINTNLKIHIVHREGGAKRYMFSGLQDVTNFLNWIYKDSTIYLDRKYESYQVFLKEGRKK